MLTPFNYGDARQGTGGGSFIIPVCAGVRVNEKLSAEAGWVFMRHMGRTPVANDFYELRSGGATLDAEANNYRTRFFNSLAEATINYRVAQRATVHLRGAFGLQEFPGVGVVENLSVGNNTAVYNTQGAARLAFVYAGIGYRL